MISSAMDYASISDWLNLVSQSYTGMDLTGLATDEERMRVVTEECTSRLAFVADPTHDMSHYAAEDLLFPALGMKKWRATSPRPASLLRTEAITGFVRRNDFAHYGRGLAPCIVARMRTLLKRWLPPVGAAPLPKLGPGAVAEHFNYVRKRELLPEFANCYWNFVSSSNVPTASISSNPLGPLGPDGWYIESSGGLMPSCDSSIVGHDTARLCAVPKDWDKLRLITVEPWVNTLAQQAARSYLYASLQCGPLGRAPEWASFWSVMPEVQRHCALTGSKTGKYATIDLSDASDGISYELVASVMPAHVMAWLDWSRTPYYDLGDGVSRPLYIYAGMGNATTFLVETLVFTAYCYTIRNSISGLSRTPITVFGDDIVCGSDLAANLAATSQDDMPFFRVNTAKSYWGSSPFREACGTFAYRGFDLCIDRIRGYRLGQFDGRLALTDLLQRFVSTVYTRRASIVYNALDAGLPIPNVRWYVPGAIGISVPYRPYRNQTLRWSRDLQRLEAKVDVNVAGTKQLPPSHGWMLSASLLGAVRSEFKMKHPQGGGFIDGPVSSYVPVPSGTTRKQLAWLPCYAGEFPWAEE